MRPAADVAVRRTDWADDGAPPGCALAAAPHAGGAGLAGAWRAGAWRAGAWLGVSLAGAVRGVGADQDGVPWLAGRAVVGADAPFAGDGLAAVVAPADAADHPVAGRDDRVGSSVRSR
ncbi:hypothetical protein IC607_05335 [Cellulomonas sp. JH27-2]|uniref:hypothetical protein n=1 Tax=Cellulomonas sp. JH27-2 TaxID=2774139 RepID=UPI00177B30BF|nr:hypothetical protein [Cellulomonas sp. JH27-2]MBD8058388.1 hypothetical protein [Cellulomonas sp. JH27-2]